MKSCITRKDVYAKREDGITLLTVVVFLMVLALLGVWAASNNAMQERMAGNTRSRDLALQAAEAALRHAEDTITTWRTGTFNGTDGLLAYDATQPNDSAYWLSSTRWTSYRIVPTGTLNQVSEPPRYVIQRLPNTANPGNPTQFNVENYRVTARALGAESSAVVIVQSIVTYTP